MEVRKRVRTEPSLAPFPGRQARDGFYRRYGKRLMDIVLSLCAIVLLSPVMLMIALLVRVRLGSPVIFKQERPGLNEKLFTLYKFRTMTDERDENGQLLPDAQRLTKFGQWLRSTSLDELPELLNVLKGEMSLVGPRPLLAQYLPLYNSHQRRRHEVRPGITGLAQIGGRNAISWEERFDLDVYYVDAVSLLGDIRIMFSTMQKILAREGISSSDSVTMTAFRGTPRSQTVITQRLEEHVGK
jgi:undecaprenyl phosphate N,N'-diacetylbacillosamine 1-phosphate transferase